ncbi:putative nucleosome assembly protein-like protein [Leptotrombidium deliense]|uniref:Putative nucleosome assembly protein-like protein n=1 Tax=Leptotrombidium deliense TaxID=299467 RepID=A0A443SDA6_9ACAR|nr:putative nucleosome assembly protein-like protein [Leptotrombidium deliense]
MLFRADKALKEKFRTLKAKNAALRQPISDKRAAIINVLKNDDYFDGVILPKDEIALKSLMDIKAIINKSDFNFVIEFHFGSNDFSTNEKLKRYEVSCDVPTVASFDYVGRDIVKTEG